MNKKRTAIAALIVSGLIATTSSAAFAHDGGGKGRHGEGNRNAKGRRETNESYVSPGGKRIRRGCAQTDRETIRGSARKATTSKL